MNRINKYSLENNYVFIAKLTTPRTFFSFAYSQWWQQYIWVAVDLEEDFSEHLDTFQVSENQRNQNIVRESFNQVSDNQGNLFYQNSVRKRFIILNHVFLTVISWWDQPYWIFCLVFFWYLSFKQLMKHSIWTVT